MSADFLILEVYRNVVGLPKRDLAIFEVDDSGSAAAPLTNVPEERRIWRHIHHAHGPNLQSTRGLEVLTKVFTREFLEVVNRQPLDEWTTTPIYRFFRNEMSTASGIALIGRGPFIHNPRLMEDFWEFFAGFMSLFLGLPRFMAPKIFDARTRMVDACVSTLKSIEGRYESIQAKNLDWDEDLGSRVNQDREKAMIDCGLSIEGRGAMMAGFLIGVNGNAIPIASWILLEAIQDAKLLMALREEIMTAVMQNKESPEDIHLDIPKLLSLPLLSSVYTETLRLRISTTATRKLRNDLEVDGYILKAGNMVMVPSWLAHTDDEWSTPSHPATSFWARRFLEGDGTVTSGKPISATHPGKYFPFGGGSSMCPGRFFAKQEVLAAVALMIAKFEMEFVGYVTHEGKKSERGPRPDLKNAGSGALVPDGDLMRPELDEHEPSSPQPQAIIFRYCPLRLLPLNLILLSNQLPTTNATCSTLEQTGDALDTLSSYGTTYRQTLDFISCPLTSNNSTCQLALKTYVITIPTSINVSSHQTPTEADWPTLQSEEANSNVFNTTSDPDDSASIFTLVASKWAALGLNKSTTDRWVVPSPQTVTVSTLNITTSNSWVLNGSLTVAAGYNMTLYYNPFMTFMWGRVTGCDNESLNAWPVEATMPYYFVANDSSTVLAGIFVAEATWLNETVAAAAAKKSVGAGLKWNDNWMIALIALGVLSFFKL
ncbi:hypothetical protein G7Y89_g4045 [Cudoniella acicularis]|uniref:Cytochrome P450 n=1 Tax=Cudoniella acicularis TaxID=354080 RepID=A0A8H4RQ81_9HELO|nr:hypothetical protein G7Y89_g4045 [Cudoniella acicularis]